MEECKYFECAEVATLEKNLQEEKEHVQRLLKERKEFLGEIDELRNDILCLTRELRQVNEDKAHISDLSKKEGALTRENRELKKDVISLTRENREMKDIIEELNSLCNEKLAEVHELKKIVERFESGEVMLIEC